MAPKPAPKLECLPVTRRCHHAKAYNSVGFHEAACQHPRSSANRLAVPSWELASSRHLPQVRSLAYMLPTRTTAQSWPYSGANAVH